MSNFSTEFHYDETTLHLSFNNMGFGLLNSNDIINQNSMIDDFEDDQNNVNNYLEINIEPTNNDDIYSKLLNDNVEEYSSNIETLSNENESTTSSQSTNLDECVICLEPIEKFTYYRFDCNHTMHKLCFKNYFQFHYDFENNFVKCPLCSTQLSYQSVLKMAKSDESLINHFDQTIQNREEEEVLLQPLNININQGEYPTFRSQLKEIIIFFYPFIAFSLLFGSTYMLMVDFNSKE